MNDIDFRQAWALFELALTCVIILIYAIQIVFKRDLDIKQRILACAMLLPIFLLPLPLIGLPFDLPLVAYVRGATGDLSIVTTLLLWSYFFIPTQKNLPPSFKVGIILIGVFFYPCALGIGMIDPYAWGYGSLLSLLAIVGLGIGMWLAKWHREVIILAIAILCWSFKLHESSNLWDYLLDPLLFIWCLGTVIRQKIARKSVVKYP